MNLSVVQKRDIFKSLASESQFFVAKKFEFDKHYKSNGGMVNAVNKIYREVKEHPEQFGISQDILTLVETSMEARRNTKNEVREPLIIPEVDTKDLVVGAQKKAWILLNKKLDYLFKNKRALKSESLMSIAKMAGISFDKAQIVKGEATEHIMLKARIDQNITPEQAIEQLLQFRESNITEDAG